ncbi:hypothetical protein pipiens_001055 [Culex pipiens pipiens]|uniref:Uncharacterized protein n=1 Tax=Culex pipiens pipiens TaxID=38569 RepID=A0ABD1D366_CULPP
MVVNRSLANTMEDVCKNIIVVGESERTEPDSTSAGLKRCRNGPSSPGSRTTMVAHGQATSNKAQEQSAAESVSLKERKHQFDGDEHDGTLERSLAGSTPIK